MIQICFQFMYIECRCEGSLVTGPTARDDPVWLVKAKRERTGSRYRPALKSKFSLINSAIVLIFETNVVIWR